MTASQEPPLTRREARERERLRQEAATHSAPPQAAPQQHAPQAPIPAPQPAAVPAPQHGSTPAAWPPAGSPFAPPAERTWSPPATPAQPPAPQPDPGWAPRIPASTSAPAAPPAERGWAPQAAPAQAPTSAPVPAPAAPSVPVERPAPPQWPASGPAEPTGTPERTLTRRELRAMLDGHAGDGLEEFDELDDDEPRAAAASVAPHVAARPVNPAPRAGAAPHSAPGPHPAEPAAQADLPAPIPTRPVAQSARTELELDEPETPHKPIGHWTSQLDLPDEPAEPYDQLLSRGGVSRGVPTTTNALILPTLPDQGALPAPVDGGDIIVTGSIDLPRSFGATGVHPSRIDSSEVDRLFDQVEDVPGTSAAPVSATRAVSTQSAARAMMTPPRKDGMNVPLVLAVTAGVLALGVVGTLIVGAVAGLF